MYVYIQQVSNLITPINRVAVIWPLPVVPGSYGTLRSMAYPVRYRTKHSNNARRTLLRWILEQRIHDRGWRVD